MTDSQELRPRNHKVPQTIGKALSVLDCFSLQESELTVAEIGSRLGLAQSTLYRYLQAMEQEGYISRNALTGRYGLGLRVIELAGIAMRGMELRRHGQLELDALANALNINANLGVLHEGDTFHLAFAVRTEVDRMYATIGRRTPAHCTAMGKAMLASLPWGTVREIIEQYGWHPLTENSIRDFDKLQTELDEITRKGYAVDHQEVNLRTMCVGAPVRDTTGQVVGAISVSSSPERIKQDFGNVCEDVMSHAERLSLRLGYAGSHYSRPF